jgi:hypothetical protein
MMFSALLIMLRALLVCVAADALVDFDLLHNVSTPDLQIVPYVEKSSAMTVQIPQ